MRCPFCSNEETKVVDSRVSESGEAIRRRRECLGCSSRFTTYERREEMPLMVVKRDGSTEPFDRGKLLRGLVVSTAKRNVPIERLEALIADIEQDLHNTLRYEISSVELGDIVLRYLQDFDKVAYIRFASVYKSFCIVFQFPQELRVIE
ncbi:MAG: transcriptional regulator NrdR [Actinobacteria bacterium]|nr:transcriptional regulator NrdR [Actinomycetota bacterium]